MNILEMNGVSKSYKKNAVLRNLNFTLESGTVLGLLGPNGAGKTTLLKTAIGLLKTDKGEASVFGEAAWNMSAKAKERIGFVAQRQEFMLHYTGEQLLDFTSAFYPTWDKNKVATLVTDWDIDTSKQISTLSEGQQQRLAIIQAMGHSPELLILDEPVASLDPAARRAFIKELIDLNCDEQTSIIFSTHITSDLERAAADVAFIREGKIQYQGGLDELKEQVVRIGFTGDQGLLSEMNNLQISQTKQFGERCSMTVTNFDHAMLLTLTQKLGTAPEIEQLSLEDIYLELNR